jgi:predicted  nucleic acid-binding Zn-ribbon protein
MLLNELELFQKKANALKIKLEAASDEKQYKDIRLSFDFNQLQIEKLQAKIEQSENEKSKVETELEQLEHQIQVLNCVLDHHSLIHEVKNFEDRKTRVATRVEKILTERSELCTMRENLNKQWVELTTEEEPEKKTVSVFSQSPPKKPEELCEALCLKASGSNYFI